MQNLKDRIEELIRYRIHPSDDGYISRRAVLEIIDDCCEKEPDPPEESKIKLSIDLLHDPSRINISIPGDLPMKDFTEELRKALLEGINVKCCEQ